MATRERDSFFFWLSILLLSLLLVGFAPTLYLRSLFDVEPIPGYLYVHGIVLTGWFVWLVVQTSLVRSNRIATHRRCGVIGAAIAAGVLFAGPLATVNVVDRVEVLGLDWAADISVIPQLGAEGVTVLRFVSGVVWGNLVAIVLFAVFVVLALLLRRTPAAHKRFMLIASIVIIAPALARISRIPPLGGEDGPFVGLVLLGFAIALIAHDLVAIRRLHWVTWSGIGSVVLVGLLGSEIAASDWGQAFVRSLG